MGSMLSHNDVLIRLEKEIHLSGGLRLAAQALGISPQLLSAVMKKDRAVGPKLLRKLKLRRHVTRVVQYEQCVAHDPRMSRTVRGIA